MKNPKTHEIEIKAQEEQEAQKKKSVAFKVPPAAPTMKKSQMKKR